MAGHTHLTQEEHLRRIQAGECLYCGKSGYFLSTCPLRPKDRAHWSTSPVFPSASQHFYLCGEVYLSLLALIDSGAEDNLLDMDLAQQLGCAIKELENPIPALVLNGEEFTKITRKSSPVTLTVSGNHTKELSFHLLSSPQRPVVLAHPRLKLHNPHIDWLAGKIRGRSLYCHSVCPRSARPASSPRDQVTPIQLTTGPSVYHDYQ